MVARVARNAMRLAEVHVLTKIQSITIQTDTTILLFVMYRIESSHEAHQQPQLFLPLIVLKPGM